MANTCGLFGDLIPNIYIDRIFLEESSEDTDNDGVADLQTPKISIQLKMLDSENADGSYSILGNALEINSNSTTYSTVDFRDYIKIHCVLFPTQEIAEDFITKLEDANYKETQTYFSLPQPDSQDPYFLKTKTLKDFTNTYVNANGITEMIGNYVYDSNDFGNNNVFEYLRVLTFVELDTQSIEREMNVELPSSFKCIISRYRDQLILSNKDVVSQLTVFLTEDGDLWDDSFHVHNSSTLGRIYMEGRVHVDTPHGVLAKGSLQVGNVQDFRLRDKINIFLANYEIEKQLQASFPEQKDILNQAFSKNSYFSEIFLTKDEDRNCRFYFAFDYGKFVLQQDKFSGIISKMTTTAKSELIDNSKITKFRLTKRQVNKKPALNHLGSPVRNNVMATNGAEIPIFSSLDDTNVNEIKLLLNAQETSDSSLIRHFTGIDSEMKNNSDGIFQYLVEIEVLSAFPSLMNQVLTLLETAAADYDNYIKLSQIPGVYDKQSRKFSSSAANPNTTMSGQAIMSSFGVDRLVNIITAYLTALDYFVELDVPFYSADPQTKGQPVRNVMSKNISTNIDPFTGSIEGILIFKNLLDILIAQVSNILSVGSNNVGVEATKAVAPSSNTSKMSVATITATEIFDHTIGARFINDVYVDNISTVGTSTLAGLKIYDSGDLVNATTTEVTPLNAIFHGTEAAVEAQGITLNILPNLAVSRFNKGKTADTIGAIKFLGKDADDAGKSKGATDNTLHGHSGSLSAKDLARGTAAPLGAPAVTYTQFETNPDLFVNNVVIDDVDTFTTEDLKTEVDVLVAYPLQSSTQTDDTYAMRGPVFETRTLGSLKNNTTSQRYYLCKQNRKGAKEVVDCFFLFKPLPSDFATTVVTLEPQPITDTGPGAGNAKAIAESYTSVEMMPKENIAAAIGVDVEGAEKIQQAMQQAKQGIVDVGLMKEVTQLGAQSNGPISGVNPNEVAAVAQGMTNFLNSVKAKVDQVAQGTMMDNISQKVTQEFNMGQATTAMMDQTAATATATAANATMGAMEMMGQAVKSEFQANSFESTTSALAVATEAKMDVNNASANTMQQEQYETANFDANAMNAMVQANNYGAQANAQANAMAQVNASATNQAMNQMANYQAQAKKMF